LGGGMTPVLGGGDDAGAWGGMTPVLGGGIFSVVMTSPDRWLRWQTPRGQGDGPLIPVTLPYHLRGYVKYLLVLNPLVCTGCRPICPPAKLFCRIQGLS